MGYETELLVGRDTGDSYSSEGQYFMVYAHVDMCKLGMTAVLDLPWVNKTPEVKKWYWYAPTGDGNTIITEDRYGDMPRPVPIADVITALKEDLVNSDYRRLKWALALLESMEENSGEELSVLLWGY